MNELVGVCYNNLFFNRKPLQKIQASKVFMPKMRFAYKRFIRNVRIEKVTQGSN